MSAPDCPRCALLESAIEEACAILSASYRNGRGGQKHAAGEARKALRRVVPDRGKEAAVHARPANDLDIGRQGPGTYWTKDGLFSSTSPALADDPRMHKCAKCGRMLYPSEVCCRNGVNGNEKGGPGH